MKTSRMLLDLEGDVNPVAPTSPSHQAMRRVGIIQPWIPQYRQAFFKNLKETLDAKGVDLHVYHGDPPATLLARSDAVRLEGSRRLATRSVNLFNRTIGFKSLDGFNQEPRYDLLILEQAVGNLETYLLLAKRRYKKLAFWGHGRTFTKPTGPLQREILRRLTRHGDWFFSYTNGGAEIVREFGFDADRITVVNNSIDSASLRNATQQVTSHQIAQLSQAHGLNGKTALFIGGLDESKRLSFLLESARIAHTMDSDFRLLVAGDGIQRNLVREFAQTNPYIIPLGPLHGDAKAVAFASSQALAMPGRVGLVAVDSFATGLPIITTNWAWHAPEFEYLDSDYNSVITPDTVQEYGHTLLRVVSDKQALQKLVDACLASGSKYSVDAMVDNFATGVMCALDG